MARAALVNMAAVSLLLLSASLYLAQAGPVEIVRRSRAVGFFVPSATEFDDTKLFQKGASLVQIAFASSGATSQSGLVVWYQTGSKLTKVSHGLSTVDPFAQAIPVPITKVVVQWIEPQSKTQPGRFVSIALYGGGQSYQFGQSTSGAKSSTWYAPPGAYLGGFTGMATLTAVNYLQALWVKPLPPLVTVVAASTPFYMTGDYRRATYFDDSTVATGYGPLTQISAVLAGKLSSGLSFSYGPVVLSHGVTQSALQSAVIKGRVVRIQGTFVSPSRTRAGYWGSLNFITSDGQQIKFGAPLAKNTTGYRSFDYTARKGHFLGAMKGWADSRQLLSISFVFYKQQYKA